MKRVRFRDVKQGRVKELEKTKKQKKPQKQKLTFPTKMERVKAFITDSFMLLMPIMYIVFYLIMGGREGFASQKLLGWIYIIIPLVMVSTVFIVKSGQTPGMKAYEIKVIDLQSQKTPTSISKIVVRQLLGVFSFLLFGWILMFFRKDHRLLHEILTDTALIKTN